MLYHRLCVIVMVVVGAFGVSRPPTLLQQPPKKATFVMNEALILPCIADGDPGPTYQWYKNGKIFNAAANSGRYSVWPGKGTLIFVRPQEDDDGYYQCTAVNDFGKSLSVMTDVRRAEFSSFGNSEVTKHIRRGSSFTIECRKPTSYPPPKISWQYKLGSATHNVIEDARHAVDIYGNLRFANVQVEDNNRGYFCVATNDRLLREEVSKPTFIRVTNQAIDQENDVEVMSTSPKDETGLLNQSKTFVCIFSGNPTPSINWEFITKDDKIVKINKIPGIRIIQTGVRLVIDRVMQLHEGGYRCRGVNTQSLSQSREFQLTVRSSPYWIVKPENQMAPPGSSVTFHCNAAGNPKPRIVWYADGQPIDQITNERIRVEGKRLVFSDLQVGDTRVIQCNASNSFGYAWADAYINVKQEPPTFISPMAPLTKRAEGQELVLNCSTYSAPPAVAKWTLVDRAQQLTGGRYDIFSNGNVRINNLKVSDSGTYMCEARNPFGVAKTSGKVVVRRRTQITLPPKDVRVYEKSEVKFVCAGSTDPLEVKNLRVSWLKDGVLIDLNRQPRVRLNEPDNSLIIGGVRPMDTGAYTCIVSNGIDEAKASASLVVQGRPDQPKEVTVDCNTKSSDRIAVVSWKTGPDNSAPILNYEIEFAVTAGATIASANTWYPAVIANPAKEAEKDKDKKKESEGSTTSSAEVQMNPGLTYRFRVRARNIVGLSEPSRPGRAECKVPAAPPFTNPTNLWAEGTQQDNIIVHWTPMSEFERNANELRYILTIRCLNCDGMPSDVINTTTITNWRDTNVPFIKSIFVSGRYFDIEKYKKYQVTIRSRNVEGESQQKALTATGYSGEGYPTVKMNNVAVDSKTSRNVNQDNQVTLRWTMQSDLNTSAEVNGFFRGFRVEWCPDGLSELQCENVKRYQDLILYKPKHPLSMVYRRRRRRAAEPILKRVRRATVPVQMTLNRLPGKARLKAWVRVINKRYAGPLSNIVVFDTATGVPGPVEEFKVKTTGVTHLAFKWNRPTQTNGNLTGYQMGVQQIAGLDLGYLKRFPEMADPSLLEGEVVGLKPNSIYRVFIWARTSAGYGVPNLIDTKTSPANQAPGPPSIRIDSVGETSVNVSFAASQRGIPGSVFYVQYRLPGRSKWEESQREFSQRWIQISELPTDTVYEVRVVATNGAGLTSFSDVVHVRTTGQGGPNALAGAAATWFIIIICLLLLLIGGLVGLYYLRRWRFNALSGEKVPTDDPDRAGYPVNPVKEPTDPGPAPGPGPVPVYSPSETGRDSLPSDGKGEGWAPGPDGRRPHYQNLPDPASPDSTLGAPPPVYAEVRRPSPPREEEWSRPPPRRPMQPPYAAERGFAPSPGAGSGAAVDSSSTII